MWAPDARQQAVQAYIAKIKEHRDAEANIKKVRDQHAALEKEFDIKFSPTLS